MNLHNKGERRENLFLYSTHNTTEAGKTLVHGLDQGVDEVFTVTKVTALDEVVELAAVPTASGVGELEGPQEVVGFLEVGANGVDLVDQVLHGGDAVLAKSSFNDLVVIDGDALLVDLGVTALVDELADGAQVGVAVGNVGLDELEHLRGGLVQTDEDTVVDLKKTEQLQDLAGLGRDVVDTADTDNEHQLVLSGNKVFTVLLGLLASLGNSLLGLAVLLVVLLGACGDFLALSNKGL